MSDTQWLTDANGNRASVDYFGSVEALADMKRLAEQGKANHVTEDAT
jgi:hypothetical protein